MTQSPDDRRYTPSHEWVEGDSPVTIGITRYAADQLGDIMFLTLPEVGDEIVAGTVCAEIDSVKTVGEVLAPVSGTVVEVNTVAMDDTSLVNSDPFGAGWLLRVDAAAPEGLLDAAGYDATVSG